MPIEIVCVTCSNTSHFAQPFFRTLCRWANFVNCWKPSPRKSNASNMTATVADRKIIHLIDRRATTICRRCHRDTCRPSIGSRTVLFFDSTFPLLFNSLTLLFSDSTILYIYPSAILSPFTSTILSLCYFFPLLPFIYSECGGVIMDTHETSSTMCGATRNTLQQHQLQQQSPANITKYCACPRKMTLMIDPHHICCHEKRLS